MITSIAENIGVPESGLRLLLSVLLNYPIAFGYRFLGNDTLKNLYSVITGFGLAWFCYSFDAFHSLSTIVMTWVLLRLIPNRTLSLQLSFLFNFGHLLAAYYFVSSEDKYDIDWTTAQCVLCLRLIGISFDYYDGSLPEDKKDHDQKNYGLVNLPSPLEFVGFCYFPGAFLVGPQISYRHYQNFVNGSIYKGKTPSFPTNAVLRCFGLGAVYLALSNILGPMYPLDLLTKPEYLEHSSYLYRYTIFFVVIKVSMMKYLGMWLLAEGGCIISGIGFAGWSPEGKPLWNKVTNIKPNEYETCTNLAQLVNAFNINTNDWTKRYIFKRLKFLNNRQASSFGALFFLALWHGFSVGYFLCFFLEFIDMEAEKKLQLMNTNINKTYQKYPQSVLSFAWSVVCWFVRASSFHYGLISFQLKTWSTSIAVYRALGWIGHIGPVAALVLSPVLIPLLAGKQKKQQ